MRPGPALRNSSTGVGAAHGVFAEFRDVHLWEAARGVVFGEPPVAVFLADRPGREAAAAIAAVGFVDGDAEAVAGEQPAGGEAGDAGADDGDGAAAADIRREGGQGCVGAPCAQGGQGGRSGECGQCLQQEAPGQSAGFKGHGAVPI